MDKSEKLSIKSQVTNTNDIIGLARPVFGDISWLDILGSEHCHKNRKVVEAR
jgi:hypothetical protein